MLATFQLNAARRRERGGAMVEFSILMLTFVPLLLYGFFLSDASYHQLEVQETVLSTTWDFTSRTMQVKDGSSERAADMGAIQSACREEYSDHTSSFDDPKDLNGSSLEHHNQLALHACFLSSAAPGTPYDDNTQASQVTCEVHDTDLGWIQGGIGGGILPQSAYGADRNFTKGGVAYCWAKAWVYNYFVPEEFLQGFSSVNLSDKKDRGSLSSTNVHGINGAGGSALNIFLRDKASLSWDTWAINDGAETLPGSGQASDVDINFDGTGGLFGGGLAKNPFYKRVRAIYSTEGASMITYALIAGTEASLAATAASKVELIPVGTAYLTGNTFLGSAVAPIPNDPADVYLVARYTRGDPTKYGERCAFTGMNTFTDFLTCDMGPTYESTPYEGVSGLKYKNAYANRGPYYMGSKSASTVWAP
jgi:hypothetical protein